MSIQRCGAMKGDPGYHPSRSALLAAGSLSADVQTITVLEILRGQGLDAIVLKGPAIAYWLYEHPGERAYADTDLLVEPDALSQVEAVLRSMGYRYGSDRVENQGDLPELLPWVKGTNAVDLHTNLLGIQSTPEHAWPRLAADPEEVVVAGKKLPVLSTPARTLHLALHAAQHGAHELKPLEDLRRGIAQLSTDTWQAAASLAHEVDAVGAMLSGLTLLPEGNRLASELGLLARSNVRLELARAGTPPVSLAIADLVDRQTRGRRTEFVMRKLFPSRSFLIWWSPLARKGAFGMLLARIWRVIWCFWHLPGGARKWLHARRAS
jgi:hypothetical protein